MQADLPRWTCSFIAVSSFMQRYQDSSCELIPKLFEYISKMIRHLTNMVRISRMVDAEGGSVKQTCLVLE